MNNERREKLRDVIKILAIASIFTRNVLDEENETMTNMPGNLKYSDKTKEMANTIDYLYEAIHYISAAMEDVNRAIDK